MYQIIGRSKSFKILGVIVFMTLALLTSRAMPVAEFEIFSTEQETVNQARPEL